MPRNSSPGSAAAERWAISTEWGSAAIRSTSTERERWDTLVTVDGAPAMRTRANGAVIGVGDVDATQEIQVLTADYAAEYGRASGGQIRMITKTGSTDFHGSAV